MIVFDSDVEKVLAIAWLIFLVLGACVIIYWGTHDFYSKCMPDRDDSE